MKTEEIYQRVRQHLIEQETRSENAHECLYRGPNGMKCAVGCLIDDEHYTADLEGLSVVRADKVTYAIAQSIGRSLTIEDVTLLNSLQRFHDNAKPETWHDRLPETYDEWKNT